MSEAIVYTKDELKDAIDAKKDKIIINGELADKVSKARKISKLSKFALIPLGAALAAIPFTGGLSALTAAPIAALTGLEVAVVIAVASIGLSLVLHMSKDYDELKIECSLGHLVLKRKRT